jgi:superoxide dismutase
MINRRSESLDAFKDELVLESKALFGSGWLWVGQTNSYIHVSTTLNGECGFFPYRPQKDSVPVEQIQPIFNPLFCINLWGSSYLFDYGLDKESYIKNAINNITWDAVVKRQLSFNAANKSY